MGSQERIPVTEGVGGPVVGHADNVKTDEQGNVKADIYLPREKLEKLAAKYPPPQEWYDDDAQDMFGEPETDKPQCGESPLKRAWPIWERERKEGK